MIKNYKTKIFGVLFVCVLMAVSMALGFILATEMIAERYDKNDYLAYSLGADSAEKYRCYILHGGCNENCYH
jgi:hypothetical protein